MKFFSAPRIVLLWLGLGLMALPAWETMARAQAATDFTTSSDGNGGLIITGYTGTVKAVVIPGTINGLTVTQIGQQAFQNQNTLTSLTFPASVTTIGQFAFQSCSGLTSVTFTAPSKLTTIGTDGFEGCSGLTSITLPPSVTIIGTFAFSHCSGLTSFTVPYGVTDIQQQSFENCTNLASITLPATVTSIDRQAFQYCTSLASINLPGSLTFIDSYAFLNCTALTSLTIPSSVSSIASYAFVNCAALTSMTFDGDAPSINAYAFLGVSGSFKMSYYTYATGFTTPSWTDSGGDTFTTTAPLANPFGTSISNNQVTITSYNGSATALDIPSHIYGLPVVAIGTIAFLGADISTVFIPNGVTSIGADAFSSSSLKSVAIPASVTSIGAGAFEFCELTSVTIPASVTNIGDSPFDQNYPLTAITVDPANPNYMSTADGVLFDKNETTLIDYPTARSGAYTVPATVTSIGAHAFDSCQSLTSVTLPAGLTSIGTDAFASCDNITSITLPDNLTSIGNDAFLYCGLSTVTIPASVTNIANQAFNGDGNMTSAVFNGDAPTMGSGVFANTHSGFTVSYYAYATGFTSPTWNDGHDTYPANSISSPYQTSISNNQVTITFYTGPGGVLDIPGKIGGLPVVAIGNIAFLDALVTSVSFPNSLTSIGANAFSDCSNLTSVIIPTSVTSIGASAFQYCDLSSVNIPASVTSIGAAPFDQNPITAITVDPANPSYLSTAEGVLLDKNETTLIEYPGTRSGPYTIPGTVTAIGTNAFDTARGLTSVTLPTGLTSIGNDAFSGTGLTSITLPNSLTSIGSQAFFGCGLTSVTIPASVTSIAIQAFNANRKMTSAVFNGNAPTMGSGVFANTATGFTVYYYQGATGFTQPTWNDGGGDSYPAVEIGQATYSQWIAGYPGTTNTSPTATPESDGVPNLLKYLTNIDPSRPMTPADWAALPAIGIAPTGYPSLTFRQGLLFSSSGTTLNVQTSTDLQTWTTVPKASTPTAGSYTIRATGASGPNGDPYMEIDFQPTGSTSRFFIRLNVTQP